MVTLALEDMTGPYEAVAFGKTVDFIRPYLIQGQCYIFVGRRHLRGDDFSIFIDKMFQIDKAPGNLGRLQRSSEHYNPEPKPSGDAPSANGKSGGVLRIRFNKLPNSKEYNRLLNLLIYFHGNCPVDVIFTKDNSTLRLDPVCNVDLSVDVLRVIGDAVGSGNVEYLPKSTPDGV